MEQYISKADVAAEIKRLDEFWHLSKSTDGQAFVENLLSSLDTIKVKEMDLEKEIKKYIQDNICGYCVPGVEETAKHFFELGLKAQKGENI